MNFFKLFGLGIYSIITILIKLLKYFLIGLFNIIIFIPYYFMVGIKFIFSRKKRNNKTKENKKLSWAIIGSSLCVYFICVFLFSRWYVQGLKIKYLSNDIINSTEIIEEETKKDEQIDNNTESPSPEEPSDNNNYVYYPNDYWDYLNVPFMNVDFNELLK